MGTTLWASDWAVEPEAGVTNNHSLWNATLLINDSHIQEEPDANELLPGLQRLKDLSNAANLYLLPVIISVGLVGNMVSLLVLLRTYIRRLSVSVYLASLASADSVFLLSLLVIWLEHIDVRAFNRHGMCQLTLYLSYSASFLSVYSVVGITVERYIAICHPLHRPSMCTTSRAKIVTSALAIAALVIYLPINWTVGVFKHERTIVCMPLMSRESLMTALIYIDTIITFILPVMTIVTINVIICRKMTVFFKSQQSKMSSKKTKRAHRGMKKQIAITRSILLISSAYMAINLPSYVMRVKVLVDDYWAPAYTGSLWDFALQRLAQFLYYTNFAINFLLYSVCSTKFRDALRRPWIKFRRSLVKRVVNCLVGRQAVVESPNLGVYLNYPVLGPPPMDLTTVMSETRNMTAAPRITRADRRYHSV